MGKNLQKYKLQIFRHYFICILPSSHFSLHIHFSLFCQTTIIEMPSLTRNEKFTCENCGTQTTGNNNVRHKKRCSIGTLYCTQRPNFPTFSEDDLNCHTEFFPAFNLNVNTKTLNM